MSVIYFVLGAFFGVSMILWPGEAGYYISVHVHLNLLGFMSMMIYGVGFHILPKFSGRHVYSPQLVRIQFWLANAGLLGMAAGWSFVMRDTLLPLFNPILIISSFMSVVAVVLFSVNILRTIRPA
jgi:cbb3-type cytochrome oxidase subunit 1